ncbi:hypothetical protein LZ31DRAFT_254655 [Colletotrichum somersetense]|nr:hypothetical protein LZ31DRAFT_254655 [Colletotrichum somersetense]
MYTPDTTPHRSQVPSLGRSVGRTNSVPGHSPTSSIQFCSSIAADTDTRKMAAKFHRTTTSDREGAHSGIKR